MDRIQKEALVSNLSQAIATAPLVILADYKGATVEETEGVRNKLRENGLRLQVVKNTLMKRAIADTDVEKLSPLLSGMTGVVVSGEDPIASARAVRDALDPKGAIQPRDVPGHGVGQGDLGLGCCKPAEETRNRATYSETLASS